MVGAEETVDVAETIALDENVTAESLGITEPSLLPDSPFYFFKTWGREIQSALTFNPVKKAELREKFANEKLIELKKIVEKTQNSQTIEKATENYQKEVKKIKEATERIKETAKENVQVDQFLDKFVQHRILHERILEKLETQVPEEAFAKIQEAREQHLEKFGEVMTRLEENKEKIQKRLETNLEKVKGSEFKDFKNLEMLKALEEKVPEAAKEAIQKAQENALKRLQGDVEKLSPEDQTKFQDYLERIGGKKERQIEILDSLKTELQNNPQIIQKLLQTRERIVEQVNAQACAALWNPVCGKDGKTYSNVCFAKISNTEIAYEGACKSLETGTSPQIREQIKSLIPKLTP